MFRYSKKENLWSTKQSSQSYHPKGSINKIRLETSRTTNGKA